MPEYIEREALIEAVAKVKMRDVVPNCDELAIKEAVCKQGQALKKIVKDFPAADVEVVRHGYWKDYRGDYVELDEFGCPEWSCYCSECDEWLTASDEYLCLGYYCPNCGAKMDGKGDK